MKGREQWPQVASISDNKQLYEAYGRATSFEALLQRICSICGEEWTTSRVIADVLTARGYGEPSNIDYGEPLLAGLVLERRGVDFTKGVIGICGSCYALVWEGRTPVCSYVNGFWAASSADSHRANADIARIRVVYLL